jgi:hypothetical protein
MVAPLAARTLPPFPWLRAVGLSVLACLLAGGCESLELKEGPGHSMLRPATMSPDSVGLEILFVRARLDDDEVNHKLWNEVDEQRLPAELRRQLAENGFRAGIVGSSVPAKLAQLLGGKEGAKPEIVAEGNLVKFDSEAGVTGRHLQLRAGMPSEIQASRVYDQLPLLTRRDDQVVGNLLSKAQGVFVLRTQFEPGGAVRLTLAPEVQHGEMRQTFESTQEGVWKLQASRPRETFPNLELSATLSAGQMLILSCLPERSGSLGHHFFTDRSSGVCEQKLIIIRLSQTQQSDL